jgi:polyhydroxyalkanoate synthesis regulator phasin
MDLRTRKKKFATAGASLALVAAMVGVGLTSSAPATVFAASAAPSVEHLMQASGNPGNQPGQPGQPGRRGPNMQQHQQMGQAYQNALAGRLGISADQLQAAQKQARIDVINQQVQAGQITQDQANQWIQAIQSGQRMGPRGGQGQQGQGQPGQGRPGMGQRGQGGPGMRGGADLATILGISQDQLRAEFQAGKSIAQIGQEHGISRDDLKAKILADRKSKLDQQVQAGRLTADQETQIMDRMTQNIDRMLDMTPGQRGPRQQPAGSN